MTKVFSIDPDKPDMKLLASAGRTLRKGGTVAFPTETVYGLGANALDEQAVEKIFIAKGRPGDNPLIVHIHSISQLDELVSNIPKHAKKLMDQFWPGPLTRIFPKSDAVPSVVTAGLSTVAIRMPGHIIANLLLQEAGCPVAAPSANISTRPSPTSAQHVIQDLNGKVDIIIDSGSAQIGIESTILDITHSPALILRPGHVTLEELKEFINVESYVPKKGDAPKSPGMKYRHYAPQAKVILVLGNEKAVNAKMKELILNYKKTNNKVGVLVSKGNFVADMVLYVETPEKMAKYLFSSFRTFDQHGMDIIIAGGIDMKGLGTALFNRMEKASIKVVRV